jgi:hypothetical protein
MQVALTVIASIGLAVANPLPFLIGVLIGLVFPNHVHEALERIAATWKHCMAVATLSAIGMVFIGAHAVLFTSSFVVGAFVGNYGYRKAFPAVISDW